MDEQVELFEPGAPPSLAIQRTKMTFRDAVEAVLAEDPDTWSGGIGLHGPKVVVINGRYAYDGYLSANAVHRMFGEPSFSEEYV